MFGTFSSEIQTKKIITRCFCSSECLFPDKNLQQTNSEDTVSNMIPLQQEPCFCFVRERERKQETDGWK